MVRSHSEFEQLARAHAKDLERYALWLCGDPALAGDLVQETLLRAWKARDRLRDRQAARSWLFTILRREHARTFERKRLDLTPLDDVPVPDEATLAPHEDAEVTLLRHAVAALEGKYREPLVLQVNGGFSCEEIAAILGITRSAVMTRLFRARQKLKAALGDTTSDT